MHQQPNRAGVADRLGYGTPSELHKSFSAEQIDACACAIALSFGDLLRRYLDRSREVIVGKPFGTKERHYLSDADLGPEGVAQYEAVLDLIDETDLSDIPISPSVPSITSSFA